MSVSPIGSPLAYPASSPREPGRSLARLALRALHAGAVYVSTAQGAHWVTRDSSWDARVTEDSRDAAVHAALNGGSPRGRDPETDKVTITHLAAPLRTPDGRTLGVCCAWDELRDWSEDDEVLLRELAELAASEMAARSDAAALVEDAVVLETVNRTGADLAAELDLQKLVQILTDAGTELCGAQFGAFFYNVLNERGEAYTLYTLSGVPREAFARFPMPRNTAIFDPTFRGQGVIRLADVTQDERYGRNPPYHGMPEGHLPVRSYLALPVISRSGEVLGGLFFGHAEPAVFTERHERILAGIAAQAAVAIDNAHLYEQAVSTQQRFEKLVNGLDAIFWEADAKTFQFTFVSARAEHILGYPSERWLSEPQFWVNILHPEDRHWAPEFCLRETQSGRDHTFEYRAQAADGREVWLRDIVYVVMDEQGQPARLRGLMLDITERKLAERRAALHHRVTQILAGSRRLEDAAPQLLEAIGSGLGWNCGDIWTLDHSSSTLRCLELWQAPGADFGELVQVCRSRAFRVGEGLPGSVWAAGEPRWVTEIASDENFTRAPEALRNGLHSAFAFPVRLGDRTVAVLEFFRTAPSSPDLVMMETLGSLAGEIGQFLERVRAEGALRASEERLRFALQAGHLGAWDWDASTGRVTWSEELERLHGIEPGTFPGTFEAFQQDMHPEDREQVLASITAALQGRGDHHLEYRIIRPDGSQRWVLARGHVKRDSAGNPVGMSGVCMDITVRKEAELTLAFLAEASATLASSLDYETTLAAVARLAVPRVSDWCAVDLLMTDGSIRRLAVAHVDPEKVDLAYALEERYPADLDAPHGIPHVLRTGEPEILPVIPPEMLEEAARDDEHREIIRSLGLRSYLVVPLKARGRILGSIAFVSAESGRIFGPDDLSMAQELARRAAMAIDNAQLYRDSEASRAVEARRARQAALVADVGVALNQAEPLPVTLQHCAQAVVDHLGAAFARIWTLDPGEATLVLRASAGLYTHLNGPHSRVPVGAYKIGRIAEERVPHLTNDVQHDARVSDQEWARREGMVAFAGYPLVVEERLVGVLALFSRSPLEEDTLGALASISDIVAQGIERKRAEQEILRLNASLERRVQERTAELREANRELESFSYSVSHDLRAPLRHIAGFADLLSKRSRERLDPSGARYLSTIQESARHAGALVDDLLAFSRMGRAEMRSSTVNLDALLAEVRKELEPEVVGRDVEWVLNPLGSAQGDPAMLRLVLRNLVQNAVKYTRPREHARIEVRSTAVDGETVVSVRDNGVGFDMRYVDKLFGVFQRLHTPEQFEGTGIGLANVRRIVQRHGGRTWAEGAPDEGATFYFSLPNQPVPGAGQETEIDGSTR